MHHQLKIGSYIIVLKNFHQLLYLHNVYITFFQIMGEIIYLTEGIGKSRGEQKRLGKDEYYKSEGKVHTSID